MIKSLGLNQAKLILHNNLLPLSIYKKYDNVNKNVYNAEHIVPQSFDKAVNSDLHILFLSHNVINSLRNNYRFVDFIKYDDAYFTYIYIKNNQIIISHNKCKNMDYYAAFNHKKRIFVPPNESKGIIARSLLYYNLIYKKYGICNKVISEDLMYKWNEMYKVNEEEYLRNLQIREFQNNLNPFIYY